VSIVSLFKIITKELSYGNAGTAKRVVVFAAGPRSHNKVTQRKNVRKIPPRADFPKRIQPDNKK
jgi:hypothetical protein